jgi:hypothetical protein
VLCSSRLNTSEEYLLLFVHNDFDINAKVSLTAVERCSVAHTLTFPQLLYFHNPSIQCIDAAIDNPPGGPRKLQCNFLHLLFVLTIVHTINWVERIMDQPVMNNIPENLVCVIEAGLKQ